MDERTVTLLLRLIHILAGIFWVGAIILIAGFLLPTARATGRKAAGSCSISCYSAGCRSFSASPGC